MSAETIRLPYFILRDHLGDQQARYVMELLAAEGWTFIPKATMTTEQHRAVRAAIGSEFPPPKEPR